MRIDPIRKELSLIVRRILQYFIFSAVIALFLWVWFLSNFKGLDLLEALKFLRFAWPLSLNSFPCVVAMAAAWIGFATAAAIFLLLGFWWRKGADVTYRRGSDLIDERKEK